MTLFIGTNLFSWYGFPIEIYFNVMLRHKQIRLVFDRILNAEKEPVSPTFIKMCVVQNLKILEC